jgi:hypothetical protein
MTKKLEELFNLDDKQINVVPKSINEELVEKATEVKTLDESIEAVNQITKNLPQISELNDLNDNELDNLASKAEKAYDDLMDLGMNVEVRYSGRIFEVASSMMGNAITAKAAKIDKKLKAIDLQLKKYKIDKDNNEDPNDVINGQGYVITDRNELIKKLSGKA